MQSLLDKVWRKRNKKSLFNSKSILTMNSCKAYKTSGIKKESEKYFTLAIINCGLAKCF